MTYRDFAYFTADLTTTKQRKYLKILDNLIIENLDYKDFIKKYECDLNKSSTLLILDPPYVGTAQDQYEGKFSEEDTLDLVERFKSLNCDVIFFNHDLERVKGWLDGVDCEISLTGSAHNSANHKRLDVMAFICNNKPNKQINFLKN